MSIQAFRTILLSKIALDTLAKLDSRHEASDKAWETLRKLDKRG